MKLFGIEARFIGYGALVFAATTAIAFGYGFAKGNASCENKVIVRTVKETTAATKTKEKIDAKTRTMDDDAVDKLLLDNGWMRHSDN